MKRSVRSGIAIAGMAGGFWLLGQAVADAAPNDAAASGTVVTDGSAGGGGGDATTTNDQSVKASNEVENRATSGDIDASGTSKVAVVAGNGNTVTGTSSKDGDVKASQDITNVVWVSSEGIGGSVSRSNDPSAGNGQSNTADASGVINSTATGGSGRNGGDAENNNRQRVNASNDVDNTARSGDIDVSGTSKVLVIAGNGNDVYASSGHHDGNTMVASRDGYKDDHHGRQHHDEDGDVTATQDIRNTVTVDSVGEGGKVSDSNNPSAGDDGDNTANASGRITSDATGGDSENGRDHRHGHDGHDGNDSRDSRGDGGDSENNDHQNVSASNDVDNTATAGDIDASGTSKVEVIAGNGNTVYCTSVSGNVNCSQSITNIINIISQANGGNVSCSNNPSAGNSTNIICQQAPKPAENKAVAPAAAPVKKAAAPVARKAALSSAQPSSQLAFTGAETSLPLTLGLLALGAGGALTLAGRRRETATV